MLKHKGKLMLVGEPMGLFIAQTEGALERVKAYHTAIAGAEFNVAVGLSRLEHRVGYFTKLGQDPFGRQIEIGMRENGIDTELMRYSASHTTGFMLKSKVTKGDPEIFYYRKNSAASTITKEDVEAIDLAGYTHLHMTGIFPALSESTRQAAFALTRRAKEAGLVISFDPNLRPQLWRDSQTMADTLNALSNEADYILPGYKEGRILMGSEEPEKIADHYLARGAKAVIVKTGPKGAFVKSAEGSFHSPAYPAEKIVDTVGAGDGFAAGFLSALMEGLSLKAAVQRANAIGTIQVMSVGDNDGLPTRTELEQFMRENPPV